MRTTTGWIGAALLAPLLGACGSTTGAALRTAPTSGPPTVASATATPTPTVSAPPHFATPQAAMRYLATAYNAHDEVDLDHVTNPQARAALEGMRSVAVNLRLVSCTPNTGAGDWSCQFDHDFTPGHTPMAGSQPPPDGSKAGWAVFTVAPADGPGWYMTVLDRCD